MVQKPYRDGRNCDAVALLHLIEIERERVSERTKDKHFTEFKAIERAVRHLLLTTTLVRSMVGEE